MTTRAAVVVTGASSQLGVFLLPRLQDADCETLAVSRDSPAGPWKAAARISWVRPHDGATLAAANPGALVSCGPLSLACGILDQCPHINRVVAFSTSSVISKSGSADRLERERIAAIAAEEEALRDLCVQRRAALLLLRPTLIWGCGLDRNVSLLRRTGLRTGFIPLAGRAAGLRRPVHADDLAGLVVRALQHSPAPDFTSPAAGGETLSYRDMASRIAASADRRIRLLTLPDWLMAASLGLLARLSPGTGLSAEMVRRQSKDLLFDDSLLRERLGWQPRGFEPGPADFEIPPEAKKLHLSL